ncbi:MAG: hypothetical protein DMF61_02015 [Blastocatellia bacterium AA13]|nr:MAG: hypothetical protein DMF61_02015 [Blastocatellia bacterium AA13]
MLDAGDQAKARGERRLSSRLYALAKQAATIADRRDLIARASYALARSLLDQGRFAEAAQAYIESRDIYRQSRLPDDRLRLAVLLSNLAVAQAKMGQYAKAKESSAECFEILSALNDSRNERTAPSMNYAAATCWSVLGDVAANEGDPEKALTNLRKSLDLFESMARAMPAYEGAAIDRLIDIANIYKTIGDFPDSTDYFNRAIERARKSDHKSELQRAFNLLGALYLDTGDFSAAADFFKESLRMARELSDTEGIVATLMNLAVSDQRQGRYDEALAHCTEASSLADLNSFGYLVPPLKQVLGLIHQAKGNYKAASGYFAEALSLAEKAGDLNRQSAVLWRGGELRYLEGDYDNAIKMASAAYRISTQGNIPLMSYLSLSLKGKALVAQRDYKPAGEALSAAIQLLEWMRSRLAGGEEERAYFFQGGKISAYQSMVDLLTAQNRPDQALIYSERAKARVLLDVLQHGKTNRAKAMTDEERGAERGLQERIASLNNQIYEAKQARGNLARISELETQLEKVRLEYFSFRDKLYVAHPELRAQRGESPPVSLQDISSLAPDTNTALLEYVVADEKTTLFIVSKNNAKSDVPDIRTINIDVNIRALSDLVETFREQLGNPHLAANKSAGRLYDLLIRPAEQFIQGRNNLVIVPDRILWDLPFQALRQDAGRYLIEDHSLLCAPSLGVLHEMYLRDQAALKTEVGSLPSSWSLLALGNPDMPVSVSRAGKPVRGNQGLQDLPEAEAEVKAIARLYGPTSKVYVGSAAREELAKAEMPRCDVLHFATHGILDDHDPMYSHIVLSRDSADKNEDGLLEAREIMALDLKARIAVLSACDTARGHISAGEGVIGMSWAFFVAGCPTTVVSQWRVNSASTSQLMIEFHRNLLTDSPRAQSRWWKADALRKAMLSLLKNPRYKEPYYWAGFVVVGAG